MTAPVTTTIPGSELKVRLGGLGLPPSWFASRMGVTMRTVVRWFDSVQVDPAAAAELEKLSDLTVKEMLKMLSKVPDDGPVVLKTYRTDKQFPSKMDWPASWHRLLTFRLWEHLTAQERDVEVRYR